MRWEVGKKDHVGITPFLRHLGFTVTLRQTPHLITSNSNVFFLLGETLRNMLNHRIRVNQTRRIRTGFINITHTQIAQGAN